MKNQKNHEAAYEIVRVSVAQMRPRKVNRRKGETEKSDRELFESMKKHGQIIPVTLRRIPAGEDGVIWEIVGGERRWNAAKELGWKHLDARIFVTEELETEAIAFCENTRRLQLSPAEESDQIMEARRIAEIDDVAQAYCMSQKDTRVLLEISKLPEDVKQCLHRGDITLEAARLIGRLELPEDRAKALERLSEPLPKDGRVLMVQHDLFIPQEREKQWKKKIPKIEKAAVKVGRLFEIVDYRNRTQFNFAKGYERADREIAEWMLGVHARGGEKLLTWGELADKHGSKFFIVPDEQCDPFEFVEMEPLRAAEMVLGEKHPLLCCFPMTGQGRHEQSMDAKKKKAADSEEEKALRLSRASDKQDSIRFLWKKTASEEDGWDVEGEHTVSVCKWIVSSGMAGDMSGVISALGIDLEAMTVDGDTWGCETWLKAVIETKGSYGLLRALMCQSVGYMNCEHEDFDADIGRLNEILGVGEQSP